MKTELLFGRRVLNLPASCIPCLAEASADALRVLLALASEGDGEAAVRLTGLSSEKVMEAIRFWREKGVLETEGALSVSAEQAPPMTRRAYTGEEMLHIAEKSEIGELLNVCEAILGKTFTAAEKESVFYLYDSLRLDFEYIVRLCKYCHDMGKPSLRYMESVGISLYDRGAVTVEALSAYIENEEKKTDMEYRIRRLYGIGERILTPKEKEYLAAWVVDWKLPYEVIEHGYHQMISSIGQAKLSYENGILKKWYEAGVRTVEDAKAYTEKEKPAVKKPKTEKKEIGFDLDEFFSAAARRGEDSAETDEKR